MATRAAPNVGNRAGRRLGLLPAPFRVRIDTSASTIGRVRPVSIWSRSTFDGHELVAYHRNDASGLSAILAIHASRDGRSCGGCRMRAYASEDDALDDVLRLSQAMSYKAALADVPVGGAKSVIIGDPLEEKSERLLLAMGRFIESFDGAYLSAPDVGIATDDLRTLRRETRWVVGADETVGPSAPYTALGVFEGMRAAIRHRFGRDAFSSLKVAIQGAGSVGLALARLLSETGAHLTVADVDASAAQVVSRRYGAEVLPAEEILRADVNVLSPNALGGILNDRTIPEIRAEIICGAANNQLVEDRHGEALHQRGILFAPDYVVSAGGLIAGVEELHGFNTDKAIARVRSIGSSLAAILTAADADGISPDAAAARLAAERIALWRQHASVGGAPKSGSRIATSRA